MKPYWSSLHYFETFTITEVSLCQLHAHCRCFALLLSVLFHLHSCLRTNLWKKEIKLKRTVGKSSTQLPSTFLSNVLGATPIIRSWENRERRDSNLGLLGEKSSRYLLAMPPTSILTSYSAGKQPTWPKMDNDSKNHPGGNLLMKDAFWTLLVVRRAPPVTRTLDSVTAMQWPNSPLGKSGYLSHCPFWSTTTSFFITENLVVCQ